MTPARLLGGPRRTPGRHGGTCVIATGGEWPAGLALLRGLRAGGFGPVAALVEGGALAGSSRAPVAKVVVPDPLVDLRAHAEALGRLTATSGAAAVLPGTEASLLAVATHPDAFPPGTVLGSPPPAVVRRATDKRELGHLARVAGLCTPPTYEAADAADYPGPYPAIVKPCASVLVSDGDRRRHQLRVAHVAHAEDLADALRAIPGGLSVVQPFVRGRLRTVNGVAWAGRVVCSVHKRSERTWPLDAGLFSYGRTVAVDPALEDSCARLLGELGWSGLFNLQFLETADGERLLIDLNPRAYHSMALAIAAGANLPAVWCDLLLGRPPRPCRARAGVRFRSEEDDLRAMRAMARDGRGREALAALLPRRRTAHAVFDRTDPGPVVPLARRLLR